MSCRCRDINRAEGDINKLYEAIEKISGAIGSYRTVIEYHNDFLRKQREAYYLEDQEFQEIENVVKQRDRDIEEELERCRRRLRNEIEALNRDISSMEREDENYHSDDDDD